MRYGGSIRAYQAIEHDLADLLADVDSEDARVYMPHRDDDMAVWERRVQGAYARAQGEGITSWEN